MFRMAAERSDYLYRRADMVGCGEGEGEGEKVGGGGDEW